VLLSVSFAIGKLGLLMIIAAVSQQSIPIITADVIVFSAGVVFAIIGFPGFI